MDYFRSIPEIQRFGERQLKDIKTLKSFDNLITYNGKRIRIYKPKKRIKEGKILQILVDKSRSAKIPIKIKEKSIEAIIDTGATRCCISLRAFKRYFDQIIETSHGINIRTADGTPINIKGKSKCSFKLGDRTFEYNFLVCETLPSEFIIGLDFLRQNRIGTTWTEEGDFALQIPDSERVCSLEVYFPPNTPKLYSSHHVNIPPRSMVSVLFSVQMKYEDFGKTYEAHPTDKFKELYPDLYMVPTIHLANSEKIDKIPVTLINMTMDDKAVHAGEMLVKLKERNLEKGSKDTKVSERKFSMGAAINR